MRQYKHLLFDLDRTLWDFEGNAIKTFQKMFQEFDLGTVCHCDFPTFHEKYKEVNAILWEGYRNGTITKEYLYVQRFIIPLTYFHADESKIGRLAMDLGDFYVLEGPKQKGLMPGAREILEYLSRKDYRLHIITNGFSEAQIPKMKTSDIHHYFQRFFLSEDLGVNKPDIRFFESVVNQLQCPKEDCIVIGDDFGVDITGAYKAGIDQIFYNPAKAKTERDFEPTFEVSSLLDIKNIL